MWLQVNTVAMQQLEENDLLLFCVVTNKFHVIAITCYIAKCYYIKKARSLTGF